MQVLLYASRYILNLVHTAAVIIRFKFLFTFLSLNEQSFTYLPIIDTEPCWRKSFQLGQSRKYWFLFRNDVPTQNFVEVTFASSFTMSRKSLSKFITYLLTYIIITYLLYKQVPKKLLQLVNLIAVLLTRSVVQRSA